MTTYRDRDVVVKNKMGNTSWRSMLGMLLCCAVVLCAVSIVGAEPVAQSNVWMSHPVEQGHKAKSIHSDVKTTITFINNGDEPIKIYWLNFSGEREHYITLQKKERVYQLTYLTHPWLITDENDNALYLYYPDAQPRTINVMKP